ncbi:hydantoinase/oxoprolinase family protein [Haloglomus halophilum]|uniref:hydantoinase/oxoprolinase family protein n=1 Tax=Haloglomus halophilum TaxID=2962672 RepID=UPI0020C996A7|nr:hydantoinase/oxoprolinase family protein [Haloglomus halophilum]
MKRVSVDIGGTFTDCVVAWGGQRVESKAPTTHHDLTEGFMEALTAGAEKIDLSVETVLSDVDSVRYGTTLGTNALIERTGERVGLITTKGHEDTIRIGRGRQYGDGLSIEDQADIPGADRPDPIVPSDYRYGIRERIDYKGDVLLEADREEIREVVNSLVDDGVRAIAVVLLNSTVNPVHELLVEEIVNQEYPSNVLGSTPVVLSHRVTGKNGEYMRSNATVINAYLHRIMREGLQDMQSVLRDHGYEKPLQLVHNTSGMAQLGKTYAIQTMHAGPVAGLGAAQQLADELDDENLITTDMGGTSFDIGAVTEGEVSLYEYEPIIDRWLINIPMVYMKTIGAGGGSILGYNSAEDVITVGPESAGSDPGPACYNRGGRRATVTDVDVVLGYLNPDYFWGGELELEERLARRAVRRDIAEPMDVSVEEAAAAARQVVDTKMAQTMFNEISLQGYDPRNFSILSYGGAGPTHACGYAEELDVEKVIVPPFSPVLSAAGAGNLDQMHMYEQSVYLELFDGEGQTYFDDYEQFNDVVATLQDKGRRDLLDEGYSADRIQHTVECDLKYGVQLQTTTARSPVETIDDREDLLRLLKAFRDSYGDNFGDEAHMPSSDINLITIRVQSYVEQPRMEYTSTGDAAALTDGAGTPDTGRSRSCYFGGEFVETPVHRFTEMGTGAVDGPAIVEHPETTIVVNDGWTFDRTPAGVSYLRRQ